MNDSLEKISHVDDSRINDNESSNSEKSKEVNDEAFSQGKGLEPRKLTESELERLSRDKELVTPFKQNKLELEAKKNWDLFYRRNKANFFKDRYWTFREFEELNETDGESTSEKKILLEIGCGVGNFVYPLLKNNKNIFAYACDFSTDAVQLLKSNSDYDETRINGFVCDITKENLLRESIPKDVYVDIVTLIFVFSAIHPDKMRNAVLNIAKILKPGGVVLVRDYGMNDYSMIRFEPGHKLADGFYARQDGTRSYFFTLEKINQLFTDPFSKSSDESNQNADVTLFHKSVSEYIFRETVNIKENLRVPRVFVQSKFIRSNTLI